MNSLIDPCVFDVIIYHGHCPDGVAAAWCFNTYYNKKNQQKIKNKKINKKERQFIAGQYKVIPDLSQFANNNVLFLDFTYDQDTMTAIMNSCSSIMIIDHHKSAYNWITNIGFSDFLYVYDSDRSGAQLAWDYLQDWYQLTCGNYDISSNFNKKKKINIYCPNPATRLWFIDDIADRDLWKWSIDNSRETNRALAGKQAFESIESFTAAIEKPRNYYVTIGKILVADDNNRFSNYIKKSIRCRFKSLIDSNVPPWKVKLIHCEDLAIISDIADVIYQKEPNRYDFIAFYSDNLLDQTTTIRLRSNKLNLLNLLEHFDPIYSGGHESAASVTVRQHVSKLFTIENKFKHKSAI